MATYKSFNSSMPFYGSRLKNKTLNRSGVFVSSQPSFEPLFSYGNGVLSGLINVDGANVEGAEIICMEEDTLNIAVISYTEFDGTFSITDLDPNKRYFLVVKEPTGAWEYRVSSRRIPIDMGPVIEDDHWSNVSLLMGFDGIRGATTFVDESSTPKVITQTAPLKVYLSDIFPYPRFGITYGSFNEGNITFGMDGFLGNPFTIEGFIHGKHYYNDDNVIFSRSDNTTNNLFVFRMIAGGQFSVTIGNNTGTTSTVTSSSNVTNYKWMHVAVTRNASNLVTIWVDGIPVGSGTIATDIETTLLPWMIGNSNYYNLPFRGGMDEFRITHNVCRYDGVFSPPIKKFPRQ